MSKRPTRVLLEDILEAIAKIDRYVSGMTLEAFLSDDRTADAVVRNLEIIGEASGRLPKEFSDAHPVIDWPQVVGLRNRIVHAYFGIDLEMVWEIIHKDVPSMQEKLMRVLASLER